jgi:transcriptional regulator with GAF, ATPase, and Fis domain
MGYARHGSVAGLAPRADARAQGRRDRSHRLFAGRVRDRQGSRCPTHPQLITSTTANGRIIVATNRDLRDAVPRGSFRLDLYYRVNVFDICIPPLRERRDVIVLLTEAFLQEFAVAMHRPPAELTPGAKDALVAHAWPGNVRELRNGLERATMVCDDGVIRGDDLSLLPALTSIEESTTSRSTSGARLSASCMRSRETNQEPA